MHDDPWQHYWRNSVLTPATRTGFAARLNEFVPIVEPLGPLSTPGAAHPLAPLCDDDLQRVLAGRRSVRAFGPQPLTSEAMSRVFASVAATTEGRRSFGSAGGLYPVEIIGVPVRVDHPLLGRVVRYVGAAHALADLGAAPPWRELDDALGLFGETDAPVVVPRQAPANPPALVLAFAFDLVRSGCTEKYGLRAGRFALLEAGHAAQNVALRCAADGLAAYELGGFCDDALVHLLGLDGSGLDIATVMLIGPQAEPASSGRPRGRWRRRR